MINYEYTILFPFCSYLQQYRAAIINKHGVRIASSCTIDRLLDDEFR